MYVDDSTFYFTTILILALFIVFLIWVNSLVGRVEDLLTWRTALEAKWKREEEQRKLKEYDEKHGGQ